MITETIDDRVSAVRHFNRFFTRQIGVLREGLLHTSYPLTEARLIFELAHHPHQTASRLGRDLGLDAGYLSRTIGKLEQEGIVERTRSEQDGRQRLLRLTPAGQEVFAVLDQRSREEVTELLGELSSEAQRRVLHAMQTIERELTQGFKFAEPFVLRLHEPGDMGWVTYRHAVLYTQEYGWDDTFEALVAKIVSDFVTNFDPKRERCWIAEANGEILGSVFLVRASDTVAKLRLLLVEPRARGMGLGGRLVAECVRFARRVGYQKMTLWTQSNLVEARHLYAKAGFTCVSSAPHHSFGADLVEEVWELEL